MIMHSKSTRARYLRHCVPPAPAVHALPCAAGIQQRSALDAPSLQLFSALLELAFDCKKIDIRYQKVARELFSTSVTAS